MEFRTKIIRKLNSWPHSQNILYHFIDDWILFQRNNFDHYDETGDPFVSQIFLIEITSGRYIHRSQGQKVDQGITQEIDVLIAKLTHVFLNTKPCSGVPIQKRQGRSKVLVILDYPYQRNVSRHCEFYCEASQIKKERDMDGSFKCSPCQEAWQDISIKRIQEIEEQEVYDNDPLEVSYSNEAKSSHQVSLKIEDEEATDPLMDFAYEVLETVSEEELWTDHSITPLSVENPEERECEPSIKSDVAELNSEKSGSKTQQNICQCCSLSFGSVLELARHRRSRKLSQRVQRKVGCLDCDKEVATFHELAKHVAKEHPQKQDEYERFLPKNQDPNLMKEPMKCSVCDFTNNSRVLNCRHIELYHDIGNHLCQECQQPNLTYYDLMIHNYQMHRKPTEYLSPNLIGLDVITLKDGKVHVKKGLMNKCHLCRKEYKTDYGLVHHLRIKHSWGMFRCDPCGELCHYSMDLSAHVIQFHGDNPVIKCPNCQLDFNLKEDPKMFNIHYETCYRLSIRFKNKPKEANESLEAKEAGQCHICGKSYKVKRDLDLHIDAHQGIIRYKCAYCEYGTNHKQVFEAHERTHVPKEERVIVWHQCEECGKQLKSAKILQRHVRIVHKGKKPNLQCKDCGESFKHYVALYKHKKQSHGFVSNSKYN